LSGKRREAGPWPRALTSAIWISCLLLQGCGRSNPAPPPDIVKTQREALEKAKATEKLLQDASERRDAQMEAQQRERGPATSAGSRDEGALQPESEFIATTSLAVG
jgi:hypothetical protein